MKAPSDYPTTGPIQGPWAITRPGVYLDMPDAWYHRDPVVGGSVSNSGVKLLLKAPKKFRWTQDNPDAKTPKDHFDFGHLAHGRVLGSGQPIVVREHDDARTKLGKLELAEIRAAGAVPATKAQLVQVEEMAAALADDPVAGRIFTPGRGIAERVLVAWDDDAGVYRRVKIDWTTHLADGSLAYVDYKSAADADPANLERTFWNFGYHRQDPFYADTGRLIGEEARFLFVVQEKEAPYLVTVAELTKEAVQWGRVQNRKALDIYRLCTETGSWPGYATDVVKLGLPGYAERDLEQAWATGALRVIEEGEV